MMPPDRYASGRAVTWLSVWVNIGLGLTKCVIGYLGSSRALLADGLHSLSDLTSDAAVLFGMTVAVRPPDRDHPFGHHKAASLVTLFIATSLLVLSVLLVVDSLRAVRLQESAVPQWPTLAVALASVAVKEFLYRRTRRIGREVGSQMLVANAWHHRTDSFSSVLAAVGIGSALAFGSTWAFLDALVAVGLGGYLGVEGVRLLRRAIDDLMDAAPHQSVIDDLREHILSLPDAVAYHDFRARKVGDVLEVDFHLLVPPELSICEAHDVARQVKTELLRRHPEVVHVLVHVEPALPEHHKERGIAGGALRRCEPDT
jgi:cation diffusion facilitator family transporter